MGGRSIKSLVRQIVLSKTYRLSGEASSRAREVDPDNRWLQHRRGRRLSAEAIRDALLAVAGSLDDSLRGGSVPPYVSPNATANKPTHIPKSGPIDGERRRSLYIRVRRNFVTPFLELFDFPDQGASVGRRNETIVPTQALAFLNGPLVHLQAKRWGERIAMRREGDAKRLDRMFLEAFARYPSPVEQRVVADLLLEARGSGLSGTALWSEVGHVLLAKREFLYVR